jgi:LacI family repressor for deo operon, udp, cdd, tsx, nupC, and nupG
MEGSVEQKVTRKDIAKLAGVSVSVVSRTLNNSGYVAEEKKKRILEIANDLHYVPHPVAMSLQQARTKQILFYCKDLHNAFNIDLYTGMLEGAKDYGYMVLINGNLEFDDIRNTMVDGIIFQNEALASRYAKEYGKNYYMPAVTASFSEPVDPPKAVPVIEWDVSESMDKAIAYLRKKGHRKIAYASPYPYSDNNGRSNSWKRNMRYVFRDTLENYYLDISSLTEQKYSSTYWLDERSRLSYEETFYDKGGLAADIFLGRKLDATAILCFNDEFATGLIQRLEKRGYRIPEDLSVMSFDASFHGRSFSPIITSIAPDNKKFGSDLATLLIRYINGEKISYFTRQPVHIREGESVKAV